MRYKSSTIGITLMVMQLMLLAVSVSAENQGASQTFRDKTFDPIETVSTVRHLLRSACQRIMIMSPGEKIDTVQLDSAINETSAAQATWEKAIGGWGNIGVPVKSCVNCFFKQRAFRFDCSLLS